MEIYKCDRILFRTQTVNVYPCLLKEHIFMANVLNDSAHSFALTLFSWQRRKQFYLEIARIINENECENISQKKQ